MTVPSVIASIVVGSRMWRKRRKLNARDPRRTRTLADFVDKLVCACVCVGVCVGVCVCRCL